MKKVLSAILAIAIIVTLMPLSATAEGATATKKLTYSDAELARAVKLGFGSYKSSNPTVTYTEFMTMLDKAVELTDKSKLATWKKKYSDARKSKKTINRGNAIIGVFAAAETLGGEVYSRNCEDKGQGSYSGEWTVEKFWGNVSRIPVGFEIFTKDYSPDRGNFLDWASHYVTSRASAITEKTIFEYKEGEKYIAADENLKYQEALTAALRLYESSPTDHIVGNDKKSVEILSLADKRRDKIINSETTITKSNTFIQGKTYTGTAYYIAKNGNDSNDGMSPETAWATISKVNSAELKYGDVVFFKRGDLWRGGDQVWGQQGVTYSAYGSGPKPIISGSVAENAAAPDKWKLFYEGKNGKKIWVYYRDLLNCSGIFFNGGKSWANEIAVPIWNGKEYVTRAGKRFDVKTGLTQNLDYFSCLDLSKIDPFNGIAGTGVTGPLYLRCDKGNPGDLYGKIDFSLDGTGLSPVDHNGKDVTVDNIKFEFFGSLGVSCAGYQGWTNTIVQNCEIGWCGGQLSQYYKDGSGITIANYSGGAIHISGPQNTAINNYIHHCASKSFVVALHDRESASFIYSDILIRGNLLEYNSAALHLVNYMEQENPTVESGFKNVSFDDNYVLYTGYGWVETKSKRTDFFQVKLPLSAIEFGGTEYKNKNDGIYITDNLFYLSKYVLVHCFMPKENQPIFSGNTYAQGQKGWLAVLRGRMLSITEYGEKYVHDELLDKTGTVLTVK